MFGSSPVATDIHLVKYGNFLSGIDWLDSVIRWHNVRTSDRDQKDRLGMISFLEKMNTLGNHLNWEGITLFTNDINVELHIDLPHARARILMSTIYVITAGTHYAYGVFQPSGESLVFNTELEGILNSIDDVLEISKDPMALAVYSLKAQTELIKNLGFKRGTYQSLFNYMLIAPDEEAKLMGLHIAKSLE